MSDTYFSAIDADINPFTNDRDLQHNSAIQYLYSDSFNDYVHENYFKNENEDLSLIHFNIRLISANIYELISYLVFDIICTSES